jgi:hypothetical protein
MLYRGIIAVSSEIHTKHINALYGQNDPGIYGKTILRRIFGKWDVGVWAGLGWLRIGTGGGRL